MIKNKRIIIRWNILFPFMNNSYMKNLILRIKIWLNFIKYELIIFEFLNLIVTYIFHIRIYTISFRIHYFWKFTVKTIVVFLIILVVTHQTFIWITNLTIWNWAKIIRILLIVITIFNKIRRDEFESEFKRVIWNWSN